MLKFSNIKVYNLREAVISCRNSMRLDLPHNSEDEFIAGLERAKKLVRQNNGMGHTTFRKGILVSFDMNYPQYITKQLQRYHWFEYCSSSSMMHRITKMDFSKKIESIDSEIPSPLDVPPGCPFQTRCDRCMDRCRQERPTLVTIGEGHEVACHLFNEQ